MTVRRHVGMFLFTEPAVFVSEVDGQWVIWSPMLTLALWLERDSSPFAYIDKIAGARPAVIDKMIEELVITVQGRAWVRLKRWMREHPAPALAPMMIGSLARLAKPRSPLTVRAPRLRMADMSKH